tara:strand:- start:478 stop:681 length:204 start_codon:yes stop_codon:yes gene_type:complete
VLKSHYSNPRIVNAAMEDAQRLKTKIYCVELPAYNDPRQIGNDLTAIVGDTPVVVKGKVVAPKASIG